MRDIGPVFPTRETFHELATADHKVIPVTTTLLPDGLTPVGIYRRLANDAPGTFLLESAGQDGTWSRYSFIGAGTAATLTEHNGQAVWQGNVPEGVPATGNPLEVLEASLAFLVTDARADISDTLPHLVSGFVGFLGWDTVRAWVELGDGPQDDLNLPSMAMNLVTDLAIYDAWDGTVTLVANAINFNGQSTGVDGAYDRAVARLDDMTRRLAEPVADPVSYAPAGWLNQDFSPQIDHSWHEQDFLAAVRKTQQSIRDGEVSQLVISRRFTTPTTATAFDTYRVLRAINPSPYMFLYTFEYPDREGVYHLVGASPETLVSVKDNRVLTHPIGGSKPKDPSRSVRSIGEELLADPKEREEHMQLVELAKSEISSVCAPGSVEVSDFMIVQQFSHILHLVSTVEGDIAADQSALDVLRANFPAGTLSGSPKNRALELLDEWEPHARGPFGGTVGYFDLAGNMDMAITIRTAVFKDQVAYLQAGAGIVAESVPESEAEETLTKATAAIRAVLAAQELQNIKAENNTR
ncbi:MAG: chorismate-binding protein [Micrococcaceae bacterium]|nr:chorismate-binding protein [Micrococcaceae bacterium]